MGTSDISIWIKTNANSYDIQYLKSMFEIQVGPTMEKVYVLFIRDSLQCNNGFQRIPLNR